TLTCAGGLEVVVGPASEIDLEGVLDGGTQPLGLRLMHGIAGFLSSGGGNGVQVRTPSAVAAVRSTQWAMRVEDRASAVFTRSGTVFVLAEGGQARLGPGDGVDVTAAGDVGPVTRWGQARIDRFDALLGPDW
ncbi:FecR domain-containing protein, partial [Cribrihabitans sp. XS_ASV171]